MIKFSSNIIRSKYFDRRWRIFLKTLSSIFHDILQKYSSICDKFTSCEVYTVCIQKFGHGLFYQISCFNIFSPISTPCREIYIITTFSFIWGSADSYGFSDLIRDWFRHSVDFKRKRQCFYLFKFSTTINFPLFIF